eukprot:scaffold23554_cov67-Phaeocystis_antarctica.AAC.2
MSGILKGKCRGLRLRTTFLCARVDGQLQRRDRLGVASIRRPHECRAATTICRVYIDARRGQQRRDRLGVASIRRPG